MGYDCTLHVVDERRIQFEFVPRLLGKSNMKSAFDERADAEELWKKVRDGLSNDAVDAEQAASYACQLAVAFCAAELPYHYERGFCLSLWPDQPDDLDATVPKKFRGDPESLFAQLIDEHAKLRGKFPQEISGNWSTGIFVPAERVAELLKWTERRVKGYAKPKQRLFRGLLLVLKYAADHKLAYWEGTDLPVDMNAKAPRDEASPGGPEEFEAPKDIYLKYLAQFDSTLVFIHGIGFPQDCRTAFVDFSTPPPKFAFIDEYSLAADRSRGGRWLTVSMISEEPFVYRVRISAAATGKKTVLEAPKEKRGMLKWAGFVDERVVALMEIQPKEALGQCPAYALQEQKGRLVRVKELPERASRHRYHGIVRLNDGTDLLIWNGDAYELRDGRFELVISLGATGYDNVLANLAYGPNGFFYLSDNRLFSVRRGEPPVSHLPKLDNIMSVSPGPMGSLLLKEGDNKRGDLGKLYLPDDGTYIRIEPECFPDEDPDDIHSLHYVADIERVLAATPERFWAISAATALSKPRYHASTGRKARG